jgi:hypothetical protein
MSKHFIIDARGFWCNEFFPDFITPAQFADRTGREYPGRALVYFYLPALGGMDAAYWDVLKRNYAGEIAEGALWHCCAFGDLVPLAGAVLAEEGKA